MTYDLASNMFYDPVSKSGFACAINGALHGYRPSATSVFILCEE